MYQEYKQPTQLLFFFLYYDTFVPFVILQCFARVENCRGNGLETEAYFDQKKKKRKKEIEKKKKERNANSYIQKYMDMQQLRRLNIDVMCAGKAQTH